MPTKLPQAASNHSSFSERRAWSRPAFNRLATEEAESADGPGPDGGQAS